MAFNNMKTTSYAGHQKVVNAVAWGSDGTMLASASSDGSARVWQLKSGMLTSIADLAGHKKSVMQVCWDPVREGSLATASHDKTVRLWDARAKGAATVIETSGENINLAYSRDGNELVVGNKKDLVTWIDVRTQKIAGEVAFQSETNEFAFDKSGLFFATTGKGTIDVYEGSVMNNSFKKEMSLPGHAARCMSIAFAPNGEQFAVGSMDSLVSLWDRKELVCTRTMTRSKPHRERLDFPTTRNIWQVVAKMVSLTLQIVVTQRRLRR
jgi:THO complex subunit 3